MTVPPSGASTVAGGDLMRAAVLRRARTITVEEVAAPRPGAGEVVVRVMANALCGSDVHAFQGAHPRVGVGGWFGHEIAGVVAETGPDVSRVAVGERVAVDSVLPCHECPQCRSGHTNRCRHYRTTGSRGDGGLAELIRLPESNVHRIPDDLTFDAAALVQPMAIAHHAVFEVAGVRPGDVVSVVGAGPVGLFVVVLCHHLGANVVVSEPHPARAERARALGAAGVAGAGAEDLKRELVALGREEGSDHAFDCVGELPGAVALATCAAVTRPGGEVTILGTYAGESLVIPYRELATREISLRSSRSYAAGSFAACLALVSSGAIAMPDLVTHRFPLDRAQEALERLDAGDPEIVKAVVAPHDADA